mgnify:CR=1 FL=1
MLYKCLLNKNDLEVVQVYNRSLEKINYLKSKTSITNNLLALKEADIYIIAISDNAIFELSKKLILKNNNLLV